MSAVRTQATGENIPLRGGAKIEIVMRASAYNPITGASTYDPRNPRQLTNVTGYSTLRQV